MSTSALKSLLLVSALFMFSASAQAAGFEKFYTVDSYGSTAEKNTFGTGDKPYLYVKLADAGLNYKAAYWNSPFGESYLTQDDRTLLGAATEAWYDLSTWNDIQKIGTWFVSGNYRYAGQGLQLGAGTYNFSVTPEPASMVLFLVGGLALAAVMYSRKLDKLKV